MTEMLCITCPVGCSLLAEFDSAGNLSVSGNGCKRGVEFARTELTAPTRSLTTTVQTVFPFAPALPVRTDGEIPKQLIRQAVAQLGELIVDTPLGCGDTVLTDLCGTGVRVIATSDILLEHNTQLTK